MNGDAATGESNGDAMTARCRSCGQPFTPTRAGHIYCKPSCRYSGPQGEERPWPEGLIWLQLGPAGSEYTAEELRPVWEAWRDRLLAPDFGANPGTRPWAFWRFDLGEDRPASWDPEARRCRAPDPAVLRLAELGLLRDDELAALHERANEARLRINTPEERFSGGGRETGVRVDVVAVELWEAVAARQGRP